MSMKEKINFGEGSFVGEISRNADEFSELSPEDQARLVGWANGCPVVEQLIEERGADTMAKRYGQVNFWYGFINRAILELAEEKEAVGENPQELYNLHFAMTNTSKRKPTRQLVPGERNEPDSVPDNYYEKPAPMNNLAGFTAPRLMVDQIGRDSLSQADRVARMDRGLIALNEALEHDERAPEAFLARFSNAIAEAGDLSHIEILQRIFSREWQEEQKGEGLVFLRINLRGDLKETYEDLTQEQKTELGIV